MSSNILDEGEAKRVLDQQEAQRILDKAIKKFHEAFLDVPITAQALSDNNGPFINLITYLNNIYGAFAEWCRCLEEDNWGYISPLNKHIFRPKKDESPKEPEMKPPIHGEWISKDEPPKEPEIQNIPADLKPFKCRTCGKMIIGQHPLARGKKGYCLCGHPSKIHFYKADKKRCSDCYNSHSPKQTKPIQTTLTDIKPNREVLTVLNEVISNLIKIVGELNKKTN